MSTPATSAGFEARALGSSEDRDVAREVSGLWWLWVVIGVAWIVASLVVLQFDEASIKTVGIIVGLMFTFAGVQQLVLAAVAPALRWLWALFGLLFLASGVICFINPEETFAGLADILGFLLLSVGVWWTLRAFLERGVSPVWWLGLIAGMLMIVMAFWTSGQFFIEKAYVLLVFAGVWALMQGITDIARAFAIRSVHKQL